MLNFDNGRHFDYVQTFKRFYIENMEKIAEPRSHSKVDNNYTLFAQAAHETMSQFFETDVIVYTAQQLKCPFQERV